MEAIESFGTAILTVAVALVIATKELIQGVPDSFVRTETDLSSIGDSDRGGFPSRDVVDLNLFSTTILEVDSRPSNTAGGIAPNEASNEDFQPPASYGASPVGPGTSVLAAGCLAHDLRAHLIVTRARFALGS